MVNQFLGLSHHFHSISFQITRQYKMQVQFFTIELMSRNITLVLVLMRVSCVLREIN